MAERIVWRVRDSVNGLWKITKNPGPGEMKLGQALDQRAAKPFDFPTREAALHAARFLKRWHVVKVTIRPKQMP